MHAGEALAHSARPDRRAHDQDLEQAVPAGPCSGLHGMQALEQGGTRALGPNESLFAVPVQCSVAWQRRHLRALGVHSCMPTVP